MRINAGNVHETVTGCWDSVKNKVKKGHPLSSEKTLVFLFAMELYHKVGSTLKIDFEDQCYSKLTGNHKYLDLLFYTDPSYKVAIEFKLPKIKGKSNSSTTNVRKDVYRDLGRLHYLSSKNIYQACFFLMATNVSSFLRLSQQLSKNKDYRIHQHYCIPSQNKMTIEGTRLNGIVGANQKPLNFDWMGIKMNGKKYAIIEKYAWLSVLHIF